MKKHSHYKPVIWIKHCRNVVIKTYTLKYTLEIYPASLLVSRPVYRITEGYAFLFILRNILYIEVEINCPRVSHREKLCLYLLTPSLYSCAHCVCLIFNRSISAVSICFLYHILVVFNLA